MLRSTRYTLRRNVVRLTWLGPAAGYLILIAALMPYSAPLASMLPVLGIGSLAVGAWVSVSTIDGDDPSQKSVVALASGGRLPARFGEAWASYLFVIAFSVIGLIVAFSRARPAPTIEVGGPQLGGGLLVVSSCALVGVALGYLFAWPVLQRTPLALGIVFLAASLLIVAPLSPVHSLLKSADAGADPFDILVSTVGVLLVAAVCIGVGSVLVRHRWRLTRSG